MLGRLSAFAVIILAGLYSAVGAASTVTIDFEDASPSFASGGGFYGTYETKGFELVSTYSNWAVITDAPQTPGKAMLIGAWGFDFNLYGDDFTLESFDIGFLYGGAGEIRLNGYRDGSLVATDLFTTPAGPQLPTYQTINLGAGWDNLDRVSFDVSPSNCCPGDPSALDNIVLTSATAVPVPAAAWLFISSLAGLAGLRLRRAA